MAEQGPPNLNQVHNYDFPSGLTSSASQNGLIPNAVINLRNPYRVTLTVQSHALGHHSMEELLMFAMFLT
jgi:hypothetical protein